MTEANKFPVRHRKQRREDAYAGTNRGMHCRADDEGTNWVGSGEGWEMETPLVLRT